MAVTFGDPGALLLKGKGFCKYRWIWMPEVPGEFMFTVTLGDSESSIDQK